jgi:hypothetical protein
VYDITIRPDSLFLPCLYHILPLFSCQLSHCATIHAGGLFVADLESRVMNYVEGKNRARSLGYDMGMGEQFSATFITKTDELARRLKQWNE